MQTKREGVSMNYGIVDFVEEEAKKVVRCLGGGDNAIKLILETATSETALGHLEDKTVYAGMGICQFDKKPFYLVRRRAVKKYRKKILSELGVDLKLVEWEHLRYNSFLSLLFCRLYYKFIPRPIPESVEGRAKYWKKYYNTYLGKGTVGHYLAMVRRYLEAKDEALS